MTFPSRRNSTRKDFLHSHALNNPSNGLPLRSTHALRFLIALFVLLPYFLHAQEVVSPERYGLVMPRIVAPIDDESLVRVPNTALKLKGGVADLGRMDPNAHLGPFLVVLKSTPQQEQVLHTLLDQQQDKYTSNYRKWLTPQQFGESFGVADSDIQKLSQWLTGHGLTVTKISKGKRSLLFEGASANIESTFHTTMHRVAIQGKPYFSNTEDISIPAAVSSLVKNVGPLNNFSARPTYTGIVGLYSLGNYLAPGDFAMIYNTEPLLEQGIDGSGVTIGIAGESDINPSDVLNFRSTFLPAKYANNAPTLFNSSTDPGKTNSEGESDLDVEWAGAVAPGAQIILNATSDPIVSSEYFVDANFADIISVSFSQCEAYSNQANDSIWEQAAAQGITVFVAAGDSGSAGAGPSSGGCDDANSESVVTQGYGVNGYASTPYNVAVGGTEFVEDIATTPGWESSNYTTNFGMPYTSAQGYIAEDAWNESSVNGGSGIWAGGGGVSTLYGKPSWQTGDQVPTTDPITVTSSIPGPHRYLPDVSLTAANHDGYLICSEAGAASCGTGGPFTGTTARGTSAATPAFAGIQALIDQTYGRQGQVAYTYYALAAQQGSSNCASDAQGGPAPTCIFNDVQLGSNSVPCQAGTTNCVDGVLPLFLAAPGYDLASGLGSVNAANLYAQWDQAMRRSTLTNITVTSPANGVATPTQDITFAVAVFVPCEPASTPSQDCPSQEWGPSMAGDTVSIYDETTSEAITPSGNAPTLSLYSSGSSSGLEPSSYYLATYTTTAPLSTGSHSIVASYSPSSRTAAYYSGSTSNPTSVDVEATSAQTPTFSNLTPSQTIVYGTPSVNLNGTLTAGTLAPGGGTVTIRAGSASTTATVADDGAFSATLNTQALNISPTPYPITYSFAGTGSFASASDSSTTLTVVAALSPVLTEPVGAVSGPQTATILLSSSFTMGLISVVTQGSPNLDFDYATGGTCAVGAAYSAGQSCTVNYAFAPTQPGERAGGIIVEDADGNVMATQYISGVGTGPLAVFYPGSESAVGTGLIEPSGVTVDAAGNVYIADCGNDRVLKETLVGGAYTQSTVGDGWGSPCGIAVDGTGNVYVADQPNNRIVKETYSGGNYTQSTVVSDLSDPFSVAVDGNGSLYIADVGHNRVVREVWTGNAYTESTVGGGWGFLGGVAVDGSGDVYIADRGNNLVVKETLLEDGYHQSTVASGLSSPQGVAVDAAGNVYIANTGDPNGTPQVLKETLSDGTYTQSAVGDELYQTGGVNQPNGVTVDGGGNVYITADMVIDDYNYIGRVVKVDVSNPPALIFASTAVGSTSIDSPQTVTMWNIGNQVLTMPIPSSGTNPSIAEDFTLNSTGETACPLIASTGASEGTLAEGTSCTLSISFTPTVASNPNGSLVLTDNNLNGSDITQAISLSGTVPQLSVSTTTTLGSSPNPSSYGQSLTITATVTQLSGTTVPTGTVQFSLDGSPDGATVPLSGGIATYVASTLTVGIHGVTALYTPAAGTAFASSSAATLSQTVNKATPSITTLPTASAITYGQTLASSTLSGGVASTGGTFAWTASSTAPTAGTQSESITFTPTDATGYSTLTGTASVTVNKATSSVTTWPTASSITYGQTLASSTLSGGQSTPAGSFTFTTPTTAPGTGTASQGVTFTPTDATDYSTLTGTASVTVNKATPSVTTWPTASSITYGQTLASSTLSGGASTPAGSFAFTTPTTKPNAGTASQSVTFTPTDATDYSTLTGTASVAVNKATSSVTTWPTASAITYGQTLASSTLSGGASTPAGSFAFTTPTTAPGAGTASQSVTFTPTDATDYSTLTGTASVAVNKATSSVTTWPTASSITYGQTLASSTLSGGASTPAGSFAFTTPTTKPNASTASQSVTFTPTDATDYSTLTGTVSVTVNKASSSTALVSSLNPSAVGQSVNLTATVTGQYGGMATGTVTFSNGSTSLGSASLSGGSAVLATTALPLGTDSITAVYGGDTSFTGSTSNSVSQVVNQVPNPAPVISGISPGFVSAGGAPFTLTVIGSGFVSGSTVYWGTSVLTTTYGSATQLTAQVTAAEIANGGITVAITVQTPSPGGGTSNSFQFEVNSASGTTTGPTFTSTTATVTAGSSASYPVTLPSTVESASVTCLNLPTGATCSYSATTNTLTITTSSTTPNGTYQITVVFTETVSGAATSWILLPILLLPLVYLRRKLAARGVWVTACLGLVLLAAVAYTSGCGGSSGGSSSPPPPQTHQVVSSGSVGITIQ